MSNCAVCGREQRPWPILRPNACSPKGWEYCIRPERGETVMQFTYHTGKFNVNYLTAPYDLLVRAFGNDGTVAPRDEYKSMAQWDIPTPHGEVEVYDYKIGKCYDDPDGGLERHEITDWHVQGEVEAIKDMLALLARHAERR